MLQMAKMKTKMKDESQHFLQLIGKLQQNLNIDTRLDK